MNDEAWKEFAKDGWKHDEVPSKRDCFEAGWKAAIEDMKNHKHIAATAESETVKRHREMQKTNRLTDTGEGWRQ